MTFDAKSYEKYEFFTVEEIESGFIHVKYTNPKSLNAFSEQNWRDYGEILSRLDKEEETQLILISSGVEKSFSSGLNLKTAMEQLKSDGSTSESAQVKQLYKHIIEFQDAVSVPSRIDTPTIGILNGINYGLALDLASAFSIRIGVEGARFSIAEVNIGITADMGSLQRLPHVVNNKSALFQHALLGDVFDVQEAYRIGYVSTVVKSIDEGIELAKQWGEKIAGHPQWAVKGTKKCIQDQLNGVNPEAGLIQVAEYNSVNITRSSMKL